MTTEDLNKHINNYVRNKLSPTQKQRDYITEKYEELKRIIKTPCFQSGSYARFTAINPVHDLDVITEHEDATITKNPAKIINELAKRLEEGYAKSDETDIKNISLQTHSVTVEFADSPSPFSIDVVPAVKLFAELNEFHDPLYQVPEILRLNKFNRQRRYGELNKPIGWIKSDPKGYIACQRITNDANPDFRHAAKLIKGWRHNCKLVYGDSFCLKSFHLEQMIWNYFQENSAATTLDAITICFAIIPNCLTEPHFPDRANPKEYIDSYVMELKPEERQLILKLQSEAFAQVRLLSTAIYPDDVLGYLTRLLTISEKSNTKHIITSRDVAPRQPWGY